MFLFPSFLSPAGTSAVLEGCRERRFVINASRGTQVGTGPGYHSFKVSSLHLQLQSFPTQMKPPDYNYLIRSPGPSLLWHLSRKLGWVSTKSQQWSSSSFPTASGKADHPHGSLPSALCQGGIPLTRRSPDQKELTGSEPSFRNRGDPSIWMVFTVSP